MYGYIIYSQREYYTLAIENIELTTDYYTLNILKFILYGKCTRMYK